MGISSLRFDARRFGRGSIQRKMSGTKGQTDGGIILQSDGRAYCWGRGTSGQLGDNTVTSTTHPVAVAGNHFFQDVGTGTLHKVGIKTDGTAWAWGNNTSGRLGDNTASQRSSPVSVVGEHEFFACGVGDFHTIALKTDGTAWGWGGNTTGRLGDGTITNRSSPVSVVGDHSFIAITVANATSAGIKSDGSVWTWGEGSSGQLGDNSTTDKTSPVSVVGSGSSYSFVSVKAGANHFVALTSDGNVLCWGSNSFGEQGDNGPGNNSVPTTIATVGEVYFAGVGAGPDTSFAFTEHGNVWAWGRDSLRQGALCSGTNTQFSSPVLVVNRHIRPAYVEATNQINVQNAVWFLTRSGGVWGSGPNSAAIGRQVADYDERSPRAVAPERSFAGISCGSTHSAAIDAAGCIWTWGDNTVGKLGTPQDRSHNVLFPRATPTMIAGSAGRSWTALGNAQGEGTSLALRDDGTPWIWGTNIGAGYAAGFGIPGQAVAYSLPQAMYIAGQFFHTTGSDHSFSQIGQGRQAGVALRHDGILYGWGTGHEVGNNTTGGNTSPPHLVWTGQTQFVALAAGGSSFAVGVAKSDGTPWLWGARIPSGAGATSVPESIVGDHSFVNVIDAGTEHAVALKSDGSVWAWGLNDQGQLGDNSTTDTSSPVSVVGGHSFVDLKASKKGSAGLKADGTVWCWGRQNGGNVAVSSSPVSVAGVHSFIQLDHTYDGYVALKSDGSAWTWGDGGALGNNDSSLTARTSPVSVVGGHSFRKVGGGGTTGFGIKTDGSAWGWGLDDGPLAGFGSLGIAAQGTTYVSSPVSVAGSKRLNIADVDGTRPALASTTFFIGSDGTIYSSGVNTNGERGLGKAVSSFELARPVRLAGPVRQVLSGDNLVIPTFATGTTGTAYALMSDGHIMSWGAGGSGRLGDDTTTTRSSPKVAGIYKFSQISHGGRHVLALRTNGSTYGWGINTNGELGDGSVTSRATPVLISGSHQFVQIDAGDGGGGQGHSVGLKSDGTAWAWGYNVHGQVGDNTTTSRTSPVSVVGDHSFIQVIAGQNVTCGLKVDGSAWTWGFLNNGALGNDSTTNMSSPTSVVGGHSFVSLSYGNRLGFHALKADGSAWGWGLNSAGELGDNSTTDRSSPVSVVGGFSFTSLSGSRASTAHMFGLRGDGTLMAWGSNQNGRLGNLSGTNESSPIVVLSGPTGFAGATKIAATSANTAWIDGDDGQAYVVGEGGSGELGTGSLADVSFFSSVVLGGHSFTDLVAGFNHFLALKADGSCWGWGANTSGKVGDNAAGTKSSPVSVAGDHSFIKVIAGFNTSIGLKADGSAWTWGEAGTGQLGANDLVDRSSPISVLRGGVSFFDVAAGGDTIGSVFALGDNGTCWAWGYNNVGRLGDGSATNRSSPVSVVGDHSFIKIVGGSGHVLALKEDGSVWAWGVNDEGQLGDLSRDNKSSPVSVVGGFSYSDIAATTGTTGRSMALRGDGTVFVWGSQDELGPMSYVDRSMARIFT